MMPGTVHIVGAGVAGLACAVKAVKQGHAVALYEATKRAGGRCRSFYDSHLNQVLDNGSHVVLGGNPAVFTYLDLIGARETLVPVCENGRIPFVDLATGDRWTVHPNRGRLPWWIFSAARRPPKSRAKELIRGFRLLTSKRSESVADRLIVGSPAWHSFWSPVTTAVMNSAPKESSALLLGAALRHAHLSSGGGLTAFVPRTSLDETFVQPALALLQEKGITVNYGYPLLAIESHTVNDNSAIKRLNFRRTAIDLMPDDRVVLALPPWAPVLKPFLSLAFSPRPSPIVNVHFAMEPNRAPETERMTGVINGKAHWVFVRSKCVSVTVSADKELARLAHPEIAKVLWHDVARTFETPSDTPPPHRVIVERRATPIQDTAFARHRPAIRTSLVNVFLAGDWVDTGLPCTLESAILSGFDAAKALR